MEMAKNVSISCKWVPYLENFPYEDENSQRRYDTLGFFQFDVEYFKNDHSKKKNIKPNFIQQIPQILLAFMKDYAKKKKIEV